MYISLRTLLSATLLSFSLCAAGMASTTASNLALGGTMRSWELQNAAVPGHEPDKANDASQRSYWQLDGDHIPSDLGVEWKTPQSISSVIVRYFDGHMVRGPWVARTQQWARLQYWDGSDWKSIEAHVVGQETAVVRYSFAPVTTTRIRLLFTEPPNPQLRYPGPGRTGIFVCEFEAYHQAPYSIVECPGCLQKTGERRPEYNEQPASDSPVDLAGPLVIEPKTTKVFSGVLRPNLVVADTQWAKQPAESVAQGKQMRISNGFLRLELSGKGKLEETQLTNLVTGEKQPLAHSQAFMIKSRDGKVFSSDQFTLVGASTAGSTADVAVLKADLGANGLLVSVIYELKREDHFVHKWLTITNKSASSIAADDITVVSLGLSNLKDLMAGNELTYPVSRQTKGGFFECLETVYWDHDGDALTYYPGLSLAPGQTYTSEKAVVGVYQATGDDIVGWDRGIREWVIEYHAHVSPLPPAWPDIYLEGWSAEVGITEMRSDLAWTSKFLETASQLGVRYMDTREDSFRVLHYPPAWRKQWVELTDKYHIGTGFWTDFGDALDTVNGSGEAIQAIPCKLSERGEQYYRDVTAMVTELKLRATHWADFYTAWPCNGLPPGQPSGKYSIYAQGQRMIQFAKDMHAGSPGMMLGADGGLTSPQFGRYADDRQHGGGEDASPAVEPDIHLDRLYSSMNREYLDVAHMTYLRPWFRLLNSVNHFGQETHNQDSAGFRYALLSAFALTGQLTFNDAPVGISQADIQFAQKWEEWVRERKDYFLHSDRLFDKSVGWYMIPQGDAEGLQGFAHLKGEDGYIFLINPTSVPQMANLTVALGTKGKSKLAVSGVFPYTSDLPWQRREAYSYGDIIHAIVPAKQVQILYIGPQAEETSDASEDIAPAAIPNVENYIGNWTAERIPGTKSAHLRSHFEYPASAAALLASEASSAKWSIEPWAFDKAYLVLYLKSEKSTLANNWIPVDLPVDVMINGAKKKAYPFLTTRTQEKDMTRCFFVSLDSETKTDQKNQIDINLPILQGLTFSGAFLDLPTQMPQLLPAK